MRNQTNKRLVFGYLKGKERRRWVGKGGFITERGKGSSDLVIIGNTCAVHVATHDGVMAGKGEGKEITHTHSSWGGKWEGWLSMCIPASSAISAMPCVAKSGVVGSGKF